MKSKLTGQNIISFIKHEIVMVIAMVLCIISCFFVPFSKDYLDYIDFRTLSLLFCLMLIVSGFRSVDFFTTLSEKLFKFVHSVRITALLFIMFCFFFSMVITNDVALILFVPFSLYVLKDHLSARLFIILIVLETLAANLGSMFTPIGNPQNLYLFSYYNMEMPVFFKTMFPYTLISFVMLVLISFLFPKTVLNDSNKNHSRKSIDNYILHYISFTCLFILALTTVARITPYGITLCITILIVFLLNKKLFLEADYCLLLTFIFLFIFVGNISHIEPVRNYVTGMVSGNEMLTGVLLSQVISNVPAALLLSGFTDKANQLLIGVNIGGLGTIIASMASLISFKFYAKEKGSSIFNYFLWFTVFNLFFLGVLILYYLF